MARLLQRFEFLLQEEAARDGVKKGCGLTSEKLVSRSQNVLFLENGEESCVFAYALMRRSTYTPKTVLVRLHGPGILRIFFVDLYTCKKLVTIKLN